MEIMTKQDMLIFKREVLHKINELNQLLIQNKSAPKKYLKSAEVREMLGGISHGTLHTLRTQGLPSTKIGGTIFYDYQKVIEFIDSH